MSKKLNPYDYGKDPEDFGITARVVEITPELAEHWLTLGRDNDRGNLNCQGEYKRDMQAGRWDLNGEFIGFDTKGVRTNGKQRLTACITARIPFTSVVWFGLPPEGFRSTDTGTNRTMGQIFGLAGLESQTAMATVAKKVWVAEELRTIGYGKSGVVPSPPTLLDFAIDHKDELEAALVVYNKIKKSPDFKLNPGIGAAVFYWLAKVDAEVAQMFFDDLCTGTGLHEEDAAYKLRRRLSSDEKKRIARTERVTKGLVIKAWNSYITGNPIGKLRFGDEDTFPEVNG